ncbi:MAG: nitrite reductase small subunit NirD [Candidatus Omnitrophica bacterium]|nr:nitrite reductase small subunit NirD [Candidatus Omnitrophota bacterium]
MPTWRLVTECGTIPVREGRRVICGKEEVALFNLGADAYLAVENRCPHRQGPLADGIVAGTSVYCPLHSWRINLETGCAISGGEGCVKRYPVKIADGKIYLAFDD